MLSRPFDSSGDILPVLSPSDLLSGPEALAAALADHLRLHAGGWWEYEARGNEVFGMIAASRYTERDAEALSSYLVSYIEEFPGVRSVGNIASSFSGRGFKFSATGRAEDGASVPVSFTA